jgi:O-antigen/teichoic acid export membrane protein
VPFAGFNGQVLSCCLLLMLFKMACAFTDFLSAQMQLSENYTAIAISSTLRGIIPLIFLCIGLIFNLQIAFLLFLFAYLICCFAYDIRIIKIPFKFDFSNIKTIFLNCFPLVLSAFVSPIMNFATRFVVEKKYSEEILGCFSSISILSIIMPLLASAVWVIFLPHFSNDFREKNFSKLKKYSFWVFLISIPFIIFAIILCYFFGEPILVFVLGENIKNYVYLAVPVVMVSGVTMLCGYFSVILLALQKRKLIFVISLAGMIGCLITVYPFVLKFGLIGAVYALLFAGITQFIIYILSVLRLIK